MHLPNIFGTSSGHTPIKKPTAPLNTRIYAVGDIHGHLSLLEELQQKILKDAEGFDGRKIFLTIGDLIDRGPDSRSVIETLANKPLPGFENIHIQGNHDWYLLNFMENPTEQTNWFTFGGVATLESYGVELEKNEDEHRPLEDVALDLHRALPESHHAFFSGQKLTHQEGDYLFVHAGVQPGIPLVGQEPMDLMKIREPFLSTDWPFEKVVVFGHTIFDEVDHKPGKIGIDTGAFKTGKLSALVLEGEEKRVLNT